MIDRLRLAAWSGVLLVSAAVWLSLGSLATAQYYPPLVDPSFPPRATCTMGFADWDGTAGQLNASAPDFSNSSTGTSATLEEIAPWGAAMFGSVRQELGTVATNDSGVRTATTLFRLGAGAVRFYMEGREIAVSDGTNTYVERLGIMDADNGEPTDGAYFRYTHSVNSGKWQAVTRVAGSETAADTGVTFTAGTSRVFRIEVNAAGSQALFYIDGALVVTATATIPSTTDYTGFMWSATRSAGTANDINPMGLSYIAGQQIFATPRC